MVMQVGFNSLSAQRFGKAIADVGQITDNCYFDLSTSPRSTCPPDGALQPLRSAHKCVALIDGLASGPDEWENAGQEPYFASTKPSQQNQDGEIDDGPKKHGQKYRSGSLGIHSPDH